jgi:tRNA isopentenyl-2-thiomethyl-A-37 hydroxylase MiaE
MDDKMEVTSREDEKILRSVADVMQYGIPDFKNFGRRALPYHIEIKDRVATVFNRSYTKILIVGTLSDSQIDALQNACPYFDDRGVWLYQDGMWEDAKRRKEYFVLLGEVANLDISSHGMEFGEFKKDGAK